MAIVVGCQNSVTPEPIDKKIDTCDKLTVYAKFHKIRRQYGEMYTSCIFFISRPSDFSRAYTEKHSTISSI